jgi:hypothetical protein
MATRQIISSILALDASLRQTNAPAPKAQLWSDAASEKGARAADRKTQKSPARGPGFLNRRAPNEARMKLGSIT